MHMQLAVPLACCDHSFMQAPVERLLDIITERVDNKVTSLSKSMFTVLRKWKGLLKLEWDNAMN